MGCGAPMCENYCNPTEAYEYGVRWRHDGYVHRTRMTLEEAEEFVKSFDEAGFKKGVLQIIRRPVARWEVLEDEVDKG